MDERSNQGGAAAGAGTGAGAQPRVGPLHCILTARQVQLCSDCACLEALLRGGSFLDRQVMVSGERTAFPHA
jgi:hypothetical protein